MDLRKLKTLIDLVQNSGISELEISEGEEKIRIAKHSSAPSTTVMMNAPAGTGMPQAAPAAAVPAAEAAGEGHPGAVRAKSGAVWPGARLATVARHACSGSRRPEGSRAPPPGRRTAR